MLRQTNILMDSEVHKKIKVLAATHDVTIGGMLRRLLDHYQGRPNFRCPEYLAWLQKVVEVGREHGDQAAEEFARNNPFMG